MILRACRDVLSLAPERIHGFAMNVGSADADVLEKVVVELEEATPRAGALTPKVREVGDPPESRQQRDTPRLTPTRRPRRERHDGSDRPTIAGPRGAGIDALIPSAHPLLLLADRQSLPGCQAETTVGCDKMEGARYDSVSAQQKCVTTVM